MISAEKKQIGNKRVMPFTIPSGIVMTDVCCAERMLKKIPELGIWTTKSIGEKERVVPQGDEVLHPSPNKEYGFREPIFAQIGEGTYVNAVRLVNPGKDKMREHLLKADIPKDVVINASVFGGTIKEVVSVIKTLEDVVDVFEINGSCPHSEKGGILIGLDSKSVYEFTKAAVNATKKPVLFKLTPNTDKIGLLAKAVKEAGGYGITLINTVGPHIYYFDGYPVLTSKMGGGISGKGILERGLECVGEARQAVGRDFLVIGMGGIATARDVEEYASAGADFFGIGSALAGMSERDIQNYFFALRKDLERGTENASSLLKKVDMRYKKVRIESIANSGCDFKIFRTSDSMKASPGQFVFAWIPNVGEKPFSVMDDNPLTLGVLERGEFTKRFNQLKEGDCFYVRGPYGEPPDVIDRRDVVLVGGGCGIAGIYFFAKQFSKTNRIVTLLGARDKHHIPYLREFERFSKVYAATEDGSFGKKGLVTDLFNEFSLREESYFFNCGPRAMVAAVLPLELKVSAPERVYSSVDYMTRCGVGICGSCADEKGRRTCVEGPFANP